MDFIYFVGKNIPQNMKDSDIFMALSQWPAFKVSPFWVHFQGLFTAWPIEAYWCAQELHEAPPIDHLVTKHLDQPGEEFPSSRTLGPLIFEKEGLTWFDHGVPILKGGGSTIV